MRNLHMDANSHLDNKTPSLKISLNMNEHRNNFCRTVQILKTVKPDLDFSPAKFNEIVFY